MNGYSGQGFSLRGEKNRLALPAAFRKAVTESSGNERVLCLAKHDRWKCLTGFGLARTASFESQLDREEERATRLGREFDRDLRSMQLWGFEQVPFDASGRGFARRTQHEFRREQKQGPKKQAAQKDQPGGPDQWRLDFEFFQ